MNIRNSIAACVAAGLVSGLAWGAPNWTLGPATGTQRKPWSRLVDVTFNVTAPANAQAGLFGLVVSNATGEVARRTAAQLEQDGRIRAGVAHVVWDPMKDIPGRALADLTYHPYVEAENDGTYLDVDLGTGAATYRDASFASEVNADLYKTTHLVLRRVPATTSREWTAAHGGAETFVHGWQNNYSTTGIRAMTPHPVKLTEGYYLGVFEVTRKQWELVSGGACPAYFLGDTRPVECATYTEVRGGRWPADGHAQVGPDSFLARLRARTGLAFDLPTTAQWEHAARAGSSANQNGLAAYARFWEDGKGWSENPPADVDPSAGGTGDVGSLEPNAWGFYDMCGNVYEWCLEWDGLADLDATPQVDPVGPNSATNNLRLAKGGSWWNYSGGSAPGNQYGFGPDSALKYLGLRVALPSGCSVPASLAAKAAQEAADADTPPLRVGVLADVHVTHAATDGSRHANSDYYLKLAFRQFKARGVDAVVIAGDIANTGLRSELKVTGDAWREVFPGNRDDSGRPVEKVFVYGNHDVLGPQDGTAADDRYVQTDRAAAWREAFDEDYSDVYVKDVKGYKFVGVHWGKEAVESPAFLAAHASELAGAKPFFHVQHPHPRNTVFGSWAWGADGGNSTTALSAFTNAVSISGHSHYPFTDGHALWQGSFTALCPASLCYTGLPYGRENGEARSGEVKHQAQMSTDGHHAMIFNVYADRIVVERWDVAHAERVDADWTIPLPVTAGNMPWTFAAQAAREVAPEFPEGAVAKLSWKENQPRRDGVLEHQFYATFPAALRGPDPARVQEYIVETVVQGSTVDYVAKTKRVFADRYFLAPGRIGETGSCTVGSREDIPSGARLHFRVTPVGPFGTAGRPIVSPWNINWSW
ncbi:MAG: SUMF1/EgtB/PvdO family nonheme iron enzyme [Kiritimatiellae bacterium]|nr:SUMF1/EgtB/PvdO family nonheme iron enzyme [Kiritimatiellia bacterium]